MSNPYAPPPPGAPPPAAPPPQKSPQRGCLEIFLWGVAIVTIGIFVLGALVFATCFLR